MATPLHLLILLVVFLMTNNNINGVNIVQNIPGLRGLHFDIEPHILANFATNYESIGVQFLNLLKDIHGITYPNNLKLSISLNCAQDGLLSPGSHCGSCIFMYNGKNLTLMEHVLSIVDTANLMAYYESMDDVIAYTAAEIQTANTYGKDIYVAIEVNNGPPAVETLYDELVIDGPSVIENRIDDITNSLYGNASFKGTAIHLYSTWRHFSPSIQTQTRPSREMYLWCSSNEYSCDIYNVSARTEWLDFAQNQRVSVIYVDTPAIITCGSTCDYDQDLLRDFIDEAYSRGILVDLIFGVASWALNENHHIPLSYANDSVHKFINLRATNSAESWGNSLVPCYSISECKNHVECGGSNFYCENDGVCINEGVCACVDGFTGSSCENSPEDQVVTIRIQNTSIDTKSESFEDDIMADIVSALHIDSTQLYIIDLYDGSIIVELGIRSGCITSSTCTAINSRSSIQLSNELRDMIENANVVLYNGTITKNIDASFFFNKSHATLSSTSLDMVGIIAVISICVFVSTLLLLRLCIVYRRHREHSAIKNAYASTGVKAVATTTTRKRKPSDVRLNLGWVRNASTSPNNATTEKNQQHFYPSDPRLKPYWTQHVTEKGEIYYYNSVSGESTWSKPT